MNRSRVNEPDSPVDGFEVDKMHAAHRQLNVAIRLYFGGDDPVAVFTLAGAASMVFSALVEQRCPENSWDKHAQEVTNLTPKDYYSVMRRVPNLPQARGQGSRRDAPLLPR